MSYCRFTEGDVYAYDSVEGGVQFYVVRSVGEDLDRLCPTYNEAYQYAKTLRDKHGADVPDRAIDALRADALEEAERISGPGSAVAELRDENARLRDLMYDRARTHAIQHMSEDELRITAANALEENAKLRELIGILAFCTNDAAHDCDKCVMNGAEMHVTVPEWLFCDSLIERLRTLGFEVTE